MRPPSKLTYVLGNSILLTVLCVGAFVFTYRYLAHQGDAVGAILCWVGGIVCQPYHARLQKYAAWQREWDALAPPPPSRNNSKGN